MDKLIIILYTIPLLFVFCYSLIQLDLVRLYLLAHRKTQSISANNQSSQPFITIQLPIFNELYVVERLIDAVCAINYPKECLEIQILDDSTDETTEIISERIKYYQNLGFDLVHIRRNNRVGFKAGALAEGLLIAKGEFIAIFDADFLPDKTFLEKTIPYFQDTKIGMVQTHWTHLNRNFSMITDLQAFGLDAHFSVEQVGRSFGGHFINFNGTAGVWRKNTINDAGGWSEDTLTEDLDLSYRAQLKGWKFHYLEALASPAELPIEMNALKTQQRRWSKGAAECARKHLWNVLKATNISFTTKIHAFFHLLNSAAFICMLTLSVLSVAIQSIVKSSNQYHFYSQLIGFFQISLVFLAIFYWFGNRKFVHFAVFLIKFPLFLSFMMGLSLHNSLAVLEGYFGRKTPFVRTPKFNIVNQSTSWTSNKYLSGTISSLTIIELFLMLFFGWASFRDWQFQDYQLMFFHTMFTFGFASVSLFSIFHQLIRK